MTPRSADTREGFPFCRLCGTRIVTTLPRLCPLARPDHLQAIGLIQARGWRRLAGPPEAIGAGLDDLSWSETCFQCPARLHRVVRRLRAAAGVGHD